MHGVRFENNDIKDKKINLLIQWYLYNSVRILSICPHGFITHEAVGRLSDKRDCWKAAHFWGIHYSWSRKQSAFGMIWPLSKMNSKQQSHMQVK